VPSWLIGLITTDLLGPPNNIGKAQEARWAWNLEGLQLCEARVGGGISHGFHRKTKENLGAIAGGYPPFYRHMLNTNSGTVIAHTTHSMRDVHRAGWVLAIAFCTNPPLALYASRRTPAYSGAYDRVLDAI
jgi:hypothetical protein